jgi:hypothetical protein
MTTNKFRRNYEIGRSSLGIIIIQLKKKLKAVRKGLMSKRINSLKVPLHKILINYKGQNLAVEKPLRQAP